MKNIEFHQKQLNQQKKIIDDKLTENNILIVKSYIEQCNDNYDKAQDYLEQLFFNMKGLIEEADRHPQTQQLIRENREILSEQQIKELTQKGFTNFAKSTERSLYIDYICKHAIPKKKEEFKIEKKKQMWTDQERKLFEEAIDKYGKKDLKKISEYIGTRNIQQVRSHMQKYYKKLQKEGKLDQYDSFLSNQPPDLIDGTNTNNLNSNNAVDSSMQNI